jgi:hypothetical protein
VLLKWEKVVAAVVAKVVVLLKWEKVVAAVVAKVVVLLEWEKVVAAVVAKVVVLLEWEKVVAAVVARSQFVLTQRLMLQLFLNLYPTLHLDVISVLYYWWKTKEDKERKE